MIEIFLFSYFSVSVSVGELFLLPPLPPLPIHSHFIYYQMQLSVFMYFKNIVLKQMSFNTWLKKHTDRDDPVGDFARDAMHGILHGINQQAYDDGDVT